MLLSDVKLHILTQTLFLALRRCAFSFQPSNWLTYWWSFQLKMLQLFKAQCVMSREGERFGNQINDVAQLLEKDSDVFTSVVTELPCLCI